MSGGDQNRFRRDPGGPFDDLKKERYAQARAKGGSIKSSSNTAGCAYPTGMEWEKAPEMDARVKELRQGADTFVGVSVGWILNELKTNVRQAREESQLKSSTEALKLIYEIVSKDPSCAVNAARSIPAGADLKVMKRMLLQSLNPGQTSVDEALDTDGEEVEARETH